MFCNSYIILVLNWLRAKALRLICIIKHFIFDSETEMNQSGVVCEIFIFTVTAFLPTNFQELHNAVWVNSNVCYPRHWKFLLKFGMWVCSVTVAGIYVLFFQIGTQIFNVILLQNRKEYKNRILFYALLSLHAFVVKFHNLYNFTAFLFLPPFVNIRDILVSSKFIDSSCCFYFWHSQASFSYKTMLGGGNR